ncbi:S8 family serine peptidase [Aquimarina gracilis]|uniref:S8 family serine peptidase n=1 Tax=Aquimarina gracilis TaxID=874422 RepID=A0ABU5ZUD6_9FLAO|nr:S8 family serine peptidase [Aquimarina gracilis]MEB3345639.1 S8 family serine peptidase [Aquimarina gracilis]
MLKVGIIDSGIDFSIFNAKDKVARSIRMFKAQDNVVVHSVEEDVNDYLGHGTVCADIIASYDKNIEIYNAKIFDEHPKSDEDVLVEAIRWCLKNDVDLINVSLGIESQYMGDKLQQACSEAYDKGVILVAASSNHNKVSFPAYYPKVIGVGDLGFENANRFVFVPNSPIQILINGDYKFLGENYVGSSFSAPKVSGMIAQFLNANKTLGFTDVIDMLRSKSHAFHGIGALIENEEYTYEESYFPETTIIKKTAAKYFDCQSNTKKTQNIIVLPLNEKSFEFMIDINLEELNSFKIQKEEASFEMYNAPSSFLNDDKHKTFDTLAIGRMTNYLTFNPDNYMSANIQELIKKNKTFLVYDLATKKKLEYLKSKFNSDSNIKYLKLDKELLKEFTLFKHLPSIKIPVIAFVGFGASKIISKQIEFCQILRKLNYNTQYVSSVAQGNLVGAAFSFPLFDFSTNTLNSNERREFISNALRGIQYYHDPDIIVSGLPDKMSDNSKKNISSEAFNFLESLKPDALIAVINEDNSYQEVYEYLNVYKSASGCPVMLFIVEGKSKNIEHLELCKKLEEIAPVIFCNSKYETEIMDKVFQFFA